MHIKRDTKQNLCANRSQSPTTTVPLSPCNANFEPSLLTSNSKDTSLAGLTNAPKLPPRSTTTSLSVNDATVLSADTSMASAEEMKITYGSNNKPNQKNEPAEGNETDNVIALVDTPGETKTDPNSNHLDQSKVTNNGDADNNGGTNSLSIVDSSTVLLKNTLVATANTETNNNDELLRFTTSSLIERILGRLRWRREHTKQSCGNDGANIVSKHNKRAINFLRSTGWFSSNKSTNSRTGLMFDKRHHLSGISCTDGGKYRKLHYLG